MLMIDALHGGGLNPKDLIILLFFRILTTYTKEHGGVGYGLLSRYDTRAKQHANTTPGGPAINITDIFPLLQF